MNFYRIDFYNLVVSLLNNIEGINYFLIMERTNKTIIKDIKNRKVTVYNKYVIIDKDKKLILEDYAKEEEYYDFYYYRTSSIYYDSEIININEIKGVLLQSVFEFPYLIILYKVLCDLYFNNKYEIVKIDKEEVIHLVEEYAKKEKMLSAKVLERKKEK